jgi:signal transduction histidine kinase
MDSTAGPPSDGLRELIAGGGEMGARLRAFDWASSPLGPPASWPQSLKTCVRIALTSRQPMFVWWGDELVNLYNDAYKAILGGKHPEAFGQAAPVVWREIWDQVGPRAASAMRNDEGTYDEALLLIMERHGYPEETYYTFSYSPAPNDQGGTAGILCANTDDTRRILGERQLALLRDLAERTGGARTAADALSAVPESLATNPRDLPFALVYLADAEGRRASLAASTFDAAGHTAAPAEIDLDGPSPWPLADILRGRSEQAIVQLGEAHGALPSGPWSRAPATAIVLPLARSGELGHLGALIVGLNPYRQLDDDYRGFLGLVAGQIASSIANARAYEEERRRAEALAELDRAKTVFFSNVSHEFRTPLTLLLGPLEDALASGRPLGREDLATAYRNALRLLKLVNSLLDFSRIEAGRAEASYEPVDLATLTRELASAFQSAVENAGLAYEIDCPPLPEPVHVDHDMWEKIVLNLISNAFKFTLDGKLTVRLRERGDRVELCVADTGAGIDESELPHLFERFHRVQGAKARTQEGSGIGLALVHELVRLHGGDVSVASEVGAGTTFTVSLRRGSAHLPADRIRAPRAASRTATGAAPYVQEARRWLPESAAPPPGPEAPVRPAGALEQGHAALERGALDVRPGARILLADDNADMREYVGRLLRERWRVETVSDGVAALEAARRERPDLVLTDVMMPRLDGFGLLRALRAEGLGSVPVIMLSARAGEESRVDGLTAGADDYLVKPFSARELLARVSTHLQIGALRAAAEAGQREANRANRAKDEFLAMLGHELRNPLSPILTALHLMRRRGGGALERERAVIERQVDHLVRLVDDLLDVSRITRGKLDLKLAPVEIAQVVARAIDTASPLLEQHRHHLQVDVPLAGLAVSGDASRLAQVIANLLTNAAKYTPDGGHVSISAAREGGSVVVRVRDDGIGIAPEMLPRVFELFAQEPQAIDRSSGGLGLGLAIVKNLVEMHGGRVTASSEGRGHGAEFEVTLPALEASDPTSSGLASGRDSGPRSRPRVRVLVVDDNADAAHLLRDWLTSAGHDARVAHDGLAALDEIARFDPEVVLLDLGLPVMDGFEIAKKLSESGALAHTALVAITGYGQPSDRARTAAAGFRAHLVKPVSLEEVGRLVVENARPRA